MCSCKAKFSSNNFPKALKIFEDKVTKVMIIPNVIVLYRIISREVNQMIVNAERETNKELIIELSKPT